MPDDVPPIPNPTPVPTPAGGAPLNYAAMSAGPGAYAGLAPDQDSRTMGMLAHILGCVTWFLGALVIWLIKKDTSPFVNDQGKEALNWQITYTALVLPLAILNFIVALAIHSFIIACFFELIIFAAWIVSVILSIQGGLAANKGIAYRYPFAIRLIK